MKWLILILVVLLVGLQSRVWMGENSMADVVRLEREIKTQQLENLRLSQRNDILANEVLALKSGLGAVEERAREDLGMIKEGETFYMVIESKD